MSRSRRSGREVGGGGGGQAQFAQVDDISLNRDTVGFTLSQCDVSLANALRRILIAEVCIA
jgi:DNA-directed RNA polymerase alpha subunit